ncbi:FAD:protein FMN transferase [Pseudarthrobacter sp. PH31-O2]|uniref:FAD:protein FMN transferase n=1 Tax=Pseudarthrobacter sp. PH31-O2 TaxID=3046206 RepID=UPI0024BB1CFB|nr:FAD:protein FMN transferase [Pseudarthrobacter sp. PH31-O2]MDJ0353645.1 FAD:protein FMN transferase [Pseudarthrobacter sp. PH31-O2]
MTASASSTVWGLEAGVTVTEPGALTAAAGIVRRTLADVDVACSRFRHDSELARLGPQLAAGAQVSPLLALLVERALDAALWTEGDVDPTLGRDLEALGYDRDIVSVRLFPRGGRGTASGPAGHPVARARAGWTRISIDGRTLKVPADIRLDLGATAKAIAADRAADQVYSELGCGVLACLGGDLATAGPAPDGGWQVLVQDVNDDPAQQLSLGAGSAMATSSTQKRRWQHAGAQVHHILDPRFGLPAETVWRSVTVAAPTCLEANAFSTAGVVRGFRAVDWFRDRGIAGRFVDQQGRIITTGGWPSEQPTALGGHHRG